VRDFQRISSNCPSYGRPGIQKPSPSAPADPAVPKSKRAAMELIEEMRWAKKALAVSLESSLLTNLVRRIFSVATWLSKMSARASMASAPSPPIRTRSGFSRSGMAVPSATNYVLESTAKHLRLEGMLPPAAMRLVVITSAVRTCRELFSTRSCGPGRRRPPGGRTLQSSAGRWPGRQRFRGPWSGCSPRGTPWRQRRWRAPRRWRQGGCGRSTGRDSACSQTG